VTPQGFSEMTPLLSSHIALDKKWYFVGCVFLK